MCAVKLLFRGKRATLLREFLSARARVHARTVGAPASLPPLTESLCSITRPPLGIVPIATFLLTLVSFILCVILFVYVFLI